MPQYAVLEADQQSVLLASSDGDIVAASKSDFEKTYAALLSDKVTVIDMRQIDVSAIGLDIKELEAETLKKVRVSQASGNQQPIFRIVKADNSEYWTVASFDPQAKLWIVWTLLRFTN